MDDIDRALLRLLQEDARAPAAHLAKALGVARSTIQARIARLVERGVIARFTIERGDGVRATGGRVSALALLRLRSSDNRATIATLSRMKEVAEISTIAGAHDIALDLEAAGADALDEALAAIRRLPDILETTSFVRLKRFK